MLLPHGTQKGQDGTHGGAYTSAYGPDWTGSKFKFPRIRLRTNSFARRSGARRLLDFYFGAGVFKFLLDGSGFVLVDALFDRLWPAIDEVFGFLQAQAGHLADSFNDIDLVGAHLGEHHRELRLLLGRRGSRRSTSTGHDHWRGGCGRHAKTLLHFLDQVGRLEQRKPLD